MWLISGLLNVILLSVHVHGYLPCLSQNLTWDVDLAISIQADMTSLYECQAACSVGDSCTSFTWNELSHPYYPHLCFLFATSSPPAVASSDCVSGPPALDCTCSEGTSCYVGDHNTISIFPNVLYEVECQTLCFLTDGCSTYSWYDQPHPMHHTCFLLNECSESYDCDGCHSGPPQCEENSSTTSSPTTPAPTTQTTTATTDLCTSATIYSLDDETRSVTYGGGTHCDQSSQNSPDWKGDWEWYRFAGSKFNQMLDHPPGTDHCGALYTGWLQSDHPSVDEGIQPGKVCFQTGSLLDCGMETDIHIVNCGAFFIYYLPDTPQCNLRYCGM